MGRPSLPRWFAAATAAFAAALWLGPSLLAQERPPRSVLTVHSGSVFFPPNPVLDAAIRDVLVSGPEIPIDYYAEYLEADRFGSSASVALAEYVRRKYLRRHIDLVIAVTNDSPAFVLDHRTELFPDVPIVFAGIAVPGEDVRRTAARRIAVIRVGSAYVETLKLALELHPSTERVFVVARSTNQQDVESVRPSSATSRQVSSHRGETLPRVLEVIKAVPPTASSSTSGSAGPSGRTRPIRWKSRDSWPPRRRCLQGPSI